MRASSLKFSFRCVEIERKMHRSTTSFEPRRSFCFVGHKAGSTDAQEGSQTPFRWVESVQIFLFKQRRKEILRQILRVFVRFAPADAHIFVDRFPVRGSDRFEGAPPPRGSSLPGARP